MSLPEALACQSAGDHICLFYETPTQQRLVVEAFLRQGLARHEKTMYLFDAFTPKHLAEYLCEPGLLNTWLTSGQLVLLEAASVYLEGGRFIPERMIELLRRETARALDEGYTALRATGEASWALSGTEPEMLARYESLLYEFFRQAPCIALCQYDQRQFPLSTLQEICFTHPFIVAGERCASNRAYLPPSVYLDSKQREAACRPWLASAAGRLDRLLDQVLSPAA